MRYLNVLHCHIKNIKYDINKQICIKIKMDEILSYHIRLNKIKFIVLNVIVQYIDKDN